MLPPATTVRLERLLASLTDELAAWEGIVAGKAQGGKDAAAEARRFAPHRSQILHLRGFFDGIVGQLRADIHASDATQATANRIGDRILQVHAIWAWFRAKLLLRYSPALSPWLFAADELAWACFRPLAEARAAAPTGALPSGHNAALLKVPPLIYLGREVSPFVYPRDWSLASQIPGITDGVFLAVLQRAPFALVSMPYYETAHLAETLVLAHEVGHVVDLDLGLSGALDAALATAAVGAIPAERLAAWQSWRLETFADAFGAAAGGLGFCRALAEFLQRDGTDIAAEPVAAVGRYAYPTRYLRLLLVVEVLRGAGATLPKGVTDLLLAWEGAHGKAHAGQAFVPDLPVVVGAFLDTPFVELGGRSIRALIAPDPTLDGNAVANARDLLDGLVPSANDPRTLFAAATLAFAADPARYQAKDADSRVLRRVRAVAEDKPRAAIPVPPADFDISRTAGAAVAGLLDGGE